MTRKFLILLALGGAAVTLLVFVPFLSAQTGDVPSATPEATVESTAEAGDVTTVTGTIPLFGAFTSTFQGEAGDIVTLVARDQTGAVNPILTLLDPDGKQLGENDDHEAELPALNKFDAVIPAVTLPETGEYTVKVTSGFAAEGEIELLIIKGNLIALDQQLGPEPSPTPARQYLRSTGPCTVHVDFVSARVRQQPTLNAAQAGSIRPGENHAVVGKIKGPDGLTWYRIDNYLWVRADAVIAEGACGNVTQY